MKKRLLIWALCALSVSAMYAQNTANANRKGHRLNLSAIEKMATKSDGYLYKMSSYATDDDYLRTEFSYDDAHRLVAVKQVLDYIVVDSLFYNQDNKMVKLSGWQMIGGQMVNVYYIDYTYDANGNVATRTNYNYFDSWELGGVYEYSYNDDNQIVASELTMSGMVYMRVEYTYADGLLSSEVWSSYDGVGVSPSEKIYYYYDDDRRLVLKKDSILGTYNWQLSGTETYIYDEQGNCTEKHKYDAYGAEVERSIYEFETRLLAETLLPEHLEMDRPYTYYNVNTYNIEHWYSVDDNFTLQYVCDYVYTYIPINSNSIDAANVETFSVVPNPAKDVVYIDCPQTIDAEMQVVDAMGRVVANGKVLANNAKFDVSMLPAGLYVLRISNSNGTKLAKFVVE